MWKWYEADRNGDLQQGVAFAKKPENLEIAACQVVEGMRQGRTAGRPDGEQGEFLRNLRFDVVVPGGDAEDARIAGDRYRQNPRP